MIKGVPAVYENGAFRPLEPVPFQERERVYLTVERVAAGDESLPDQEFLAYCGTQADDSVSLDTVRQVLAKIPGVMSGDVRAERDESVRTVRPVSGPNE
jgi:predicted DNA-binding antitoxin AbrB/MazE fold protein